jgi:hypothetical protein
MRGFVPGRPSKPPLARADRSGWAALAGRLAGVWLVLLATTVGTWAATFTASVDRSSFAVGESATLSLTFEGGWPQRIPNFAVPPNLVLQSAGRSQKLIMEDGETRSSVSLNFQVTAGQPGDYVIPAITVQVGNESLTSQPIHLKVTKATSPTGLAFLKLVPGKDSVYLGEMFPVEVQLYLGARQDSLQMPQLEGDGFVFSKMPQPTQSTAQIGNQIYTVATFRVTAVGVKTGNLTLGPAQCSLILHVPMNTRTRSLFDDFFGGVQRKPVTLTSEQQTITVLPLPKEGRPLSFNGAVGSFSFHVQATPTNLTAGDPITLKVQVTGQGNLESLPFPAGTDWPDFKLYPPTSKSDLPDSPGLPGVKTFERVVIPENPDVKQVPGISWSYFDPDQKAYRTLASAPIPLSVQPGKVTQPTVLAGAKQAQEESPAPARDIVHVKPYLGALSSLQPPLFLRPWFVALQGVPLLAWFSALLWRKRRDQLENNPRLRRRAQVAEAVRKGRKELASLAEANESEQFFATVFRLLQEQLGEKLNLPASAITEAVLDERLRGRAPDELINRLHDLFQACNQARYAPQSSRQELQAILPRVDQALAELRALPD